MAIYPYRFGGPIHRYAFEKYAYTVLYLPSELAARPPFLDHPRLRIVGEIADHPVTGAWQSAGNGRRYFLLSKRFLKEAGIAIGDVVEMRFALDDPDRVTVPQSIQQTLNRNRQFRKAWDALTPGARRAFSHRVASAKTAPTELKRVGEIVAMVLSGERPGAKRTRTTSTGQRRTGK